MNQWFISVYCQYAQFYICQRFISVYCQYTQFQMNQWFISVYCQYAQFYICQRFISVYCQYVFLSGVYATTDAERTFRQEFTLIRTVRTIPDMLQWFISVFCQYVFLSGVCATTDVGRTFRREFTLVREVRHTAVSRRLRKQTGVFIPFLSSILQTASIRRLRLLLNILVQQRPPVCYQ